MIRTAEKRREYRGPALFSFGFRPFFLAGAATAGLVPLATAVSLSGSFPNVLNDPLAYHQHEMVFGYLAAIIAGFLLTAIPNWTGRLPVVGRMLAGLFSLWAAGRAAFLLSDVLTPVALALADAMFLAALSFFIWREVLVGRNWRNAPVAVIVALFCTANILWHVFNITGAGPPRAGARAGIAVVSMLVALIGGRIAPSFTRNWLAQHGREMRSATSAAVDTAALALTATALVGWAIAPASYFTAAAAILAGGVNLLRVYRWGGWRTVDEPLVAILHVGYLWLPFGLFLIGASALDQEAVPPAASLHALTAGLFGVMTLAVMTRATRGHTGRGLTADRATVLIYALVNIGALIRVAAPFVQANYAAVLLVASLFWCGAFLLFCIVYGRYLLAPRAA